MLFARKFPKFYRTPLFLFKRVAAFETKILRNASRAFSGEPEAGQRSARLR